MMLRLLALGLGFLVVAAIFIPLRFITSMADLGAQDIATANVDGTIWDGRIEGLSWRNTRLGDFDVATDPLSLVTGAPKLSFRSTGPVIEGAIIAAGPGARYENLRGQFALTELDPRAPSGAVLTFLDTNLDLAPNACRAVSGTARIVGLDPVGLPDMTGPLSCVNGEVILALKPASGAPQPALDLVLDLSDSAAPRLMARTDDPAAQAALLGYGIEIIAP